MHAVKKGRRLENENEKENEKEKKRDKIGMGYESLHIMEILTVQCLYTS